MKLLDKLKNALFEEEYVEVEDVPKKKEIKKEKVKKDIIQKKETPIAKKIVQPEKKDSYNQFEELDVLDEDFEVPEPKNQKNEFKFPVMDDSDFKVEPKKEIQKPKEEELPKKEFTKVNVNKAYDKKSKPYGLDDFTIPEPEHGLYEKKEDRTYFQPSPIISPIYGILDKNYKKEEIRDKKEIRLTSSYAHENLDLDEVRRKAYGTLSDDIEKEFNDNYDREEVTIEDDSDDSQMLDLSNDNSTPEVKKVTMGDAEEYFEDLGLEYNVDYKDTSKEKATGRRAQQNSKAEVEDEQEIEEIKTKVKPGVEDTDDDNLFDLIDSMYDKE